MGSDLFDQEEFICGHNTFGFLSIGVSNLSVRIADSDGYKWIQNLDSTMALECKPRRYEDPSENGKLRNRSGKFSNRDRVIRLLRIK